MSKRKWRRVCWLAEGQKPFDVQRQYVNILMRSQEQYRITVPRKVRVTVEEI